MKIILQKRGDSLYLKPNGDWTKDYRDAFAFSDTDDALDHCILHNLSDMQVVLKFENSLYDINLPLRDRILRNREAQRSADVARAGFEAVAS